MASKCQKFQPNIFNKLKCQSCFGAKDIHSAEALENNKDEGDLDGSIKTSHVGWVDQFCSLVLDSFSSKTEPPATRKISKCGYLFVSPDFDFSNPVDRSKRWQRRFFRLFDDGELNFSVDEDPDTIPQGAVDMNKCTEVGDAEKKTTHTNSLYIITPNKTHYIKGGSKEEIMWWQEVLSVFPRSLPKPKNRRFTMPIFSNKDKENVQPLTTDSNRKLPSVSSLTDGDIPTVNNRFEVEKVKAKEQAFSTYRGVRNMKHRTDKHYQEGLRKSSSLHDLSSEDAKDVGMGLASSKFLSRSGDRLNYVSAASHPGIENAARVLADSNYNNPYCTVPRRTWQTLAANTTSPPTSNANTPSSASASNPSSTPSSHPTVVVNPSHIPIIRRKSTADSQPSAVSTTTKPKSASERARLHRERSTSMKDFPTQFSLPKPDGARMSMSSLDRLTASSSHVDGQSSTRPSGRREMYEVPTNNLNQTDELKMAKSTEFQAASRSRSQPSISGSSPQSQGSNKYEDLMYMKKGWLIKQGSSEKDWKKHWFVLTGNSLRYYKDAQAEESNTLDGRIDLSTCFDISEVDIGRNFGFRIKSRNGEYVLAAMTSGIRNNWLKAIRLVMDLQTGNKQSTSSLLSNSADSSPRTVDDLDLSASADSNRLSGSMDSRSSSESPKEIHKRATTKNMRRHYSDVSPGNVKFSVKDISPALTRISQPPTIVGVVSGGNTPPEPPKNSLVDQGDQLDGTNKKLLSNAKFSPEPALSVTPGGSETMSRYVEGSDNASLPSTVTPVSAEAEDFSSRRAVSSESRKEEDEKSRRAKSPSARVKEKSRSKGGKIHTPPQQMSDDECYGLSASADEEVVTSSVEVMDLHQHLTGGFYEDNSFTASDDNRGGDSSVGGDGMLVQLLETEVDSLKEQLENTHKEMVKMHDTNIDLKTRLQTIIREKDVSQPGQPQHGLESPIMRSLWNQQNQSSDSPQVTTMRRQVKEARDTIQKNKIEIETLRSKLDMSTSKLTGTERALSEALKELKNEKDKLMKMSNDWNKKIRNLEGQLKDTTHKMERQRDSLNVKENDCKRLESDLKTSNQKVREHEREILKLKAVEQDNRQMKERMEDTERKMTTLKLELKEKDMHCKKVESEYEHHITELEQEFTQERDDMEQHLEDMKKKFMEAQEHSNAGNMAAILQEKDIIIAQLEDKMIENDKKLIDMADELQSELDESVMLQNNLESVQKDHSMLEKKLKDQEKIYSKVFSEKQKNEEENRTLSRTMEEYKKESRELGSLLDTEKNAAVKWQKEKKELLSKIQNLEGNIDTLQQKLDNKGSRMSHDSSHSEEDRSKVSDILGNFVVVEAEMSEITKTMIGLQKNCADFLSKQTEKTTSPLVGMGALMTDIVHRCSHLQDILREGSSDLSTPRSTSQGEHSEDFNEMKVKYDNLMVESNNLRRDLEDMSSQSKHGKELESKLADQDKVFKQKLLEMTTRVDDLTGMVKHAGPSKASSPQKPRKPEEASMALSAEIEAELDLLEDRIAYVDQVLRTPDISMSGEEEEDDDEDEESDSFMSSDDEMSDEEDDEEEEPVGNSGEYESKRLIGKLRAMRNQLQITNCKIQDLTDEMTEKTFLKHDSSGEGEEGLRQTLVKCSDTVDSLTGRLVDKVKAAKIGGASLEGSSAENMVAFQNCVKEMRDKLVEVNSMVAEHEALDAKSLKMVHVKLMNLLEYLSHLQRFKHRDFDMLGRITHQDLQAKAVITRRESGIRRSRLHFEEKVHLYADRLSVEAIILGQMAYLVQRYQMGDVYRDLLLKEIQDVNMVILDLERKIDDATRTSSASESGVDVVSSYAAILAEKIVLEGQLASCAMAADNQTTDDTAVLSALQITENPSILAMEVFLRCQVDTSVHQKLNQATEHMDSVTGHIITRSLVQGEISHALAKMKSQFSLKDGVRDITDLLRQERKFSHEQLLAKCETMCNSVDVYQALVVSSLRCQACLAQTPSIAESLYTKMSQSFQKRIEEFQEKRRTSEGREQNRCQHIINVLEIELESSVRNLRELLGSGLTEKDDTVQDMTVGSLESSVLQLADILVHRATIKGTVGYITDMVSSGNFPELPDTATFSSEHVLIGDQNEAMQVLARSLSNEATNKQSLAAELKKFNPENASSSEECSRIVDILGIVPDSELGNNLGTYGENLLREALHQAQLTYMSYKMKLQHERNMREMKMKIEAGQKVDLPSDSSREAEGDIHASLSVFEEILETKFEDECEVLTILDKEIKQLQSVSTDTTEKGYSQQLSNLISTFENELAVSQERHDIHVDVLRQEVSNIVMRLGKMTDDYEKEKEVLVSEYESKVGSLQEELETIQVDHEEELEQVRQDIMTAVSAIRANEEEVDGQVADQVKGKGFNRQMISQKDNFSVLLTELHEKLANSNLSPSLSTQVLDLVSQLQESLNSDTLQEFEDPLSPLPVSSPPPLPVPPRKSESLSDVPAMDTLNMTDDSFHTLDRSQHDYELELLKREKEEALAEEVKTTKAALDAMRKAYEDDLEEEKERYRIALKTMYNDDYIQDIRRQQDEELERVKEELKIVTMSYDSKCEDFNIMEEKLNSVKTEYESHIQHLVKSNQHLNELVNEEIGKLKDFVENRSMGRIPGNATLEEELYDAQIMVRMKDAELQKLRSQVKNLENNLERVTEEQRNSMTQYLQMYKKVQELQAKNKNKKQEEQDHDSRATNRSLRRTPSFHHRARSPSPQTSGKKEEHHSRDSHRRRHLDARDLKRSKSSPTIPFVFGGRLPSTSSLGKSSSFKSAKAMKASK